MNNAIYPAQSAADEIVNKYGRVGLDLVLTVLVNFYESEIEIMELCARWVPRRTDLKERGYLLKHASDEVTHAQLFRDGIERLGVSWSDLDRSAYRIADIGSRFQKVHASDDELEVLIGLNLYAEGVLALEEIEQLGRRKPEYFYEFARIYRDELTHVAFGQAVAKRRIAAHPEERKRAQEHCDWYQSHLLGYLDGPLAEKLEWGIRNEFIDADYVDRTKARFRTVMGDLGLRVSI